MKKLGIMVIAIVFLLIGICTAATCPFDKPDTPQGFVDEDGVTDISFSVEAGGTVRGSASMSESTAMTTEGGLLTAKSQSIDLFANNGNIEVGRIVQGTQNGYDSSLQSATAVSFDKPYFGGSVYGDESIYSMMSSAPINDPNSSVGVNPFCEHASAEISYGLTSGSVVTESSASSTVLPNLPHEVTFTAGISGAGDKSFASGRAKMGSDIHAVQGVTRVTDGNVTYVPTSETKYSGQITMSGDMIGAFSLNYKSTHGTGVPAGFPYDQVKASCY